MIKGKRWCVAMSYPLRLLSEKISSHIEKRVYACPCGKGTISEEQDYTPGFRDGFAALHCEDCKTKYYIDFGSSQTKWSLKSRKEKRENMDKIWLLTEERPKPSVILQIIEMYCADFADKILLQDTIKV